MGTSAIRVQISIFFMVSILVGPLKEGKELTWQQLQSEYGGIQYVHSKPFPVFSMAYHRHDEP